jgi:hypothetical protein
MKDQKARDEQAAAYDGKLPKFLEFLGVNECFQRVCKHGVKELDAFYDHGPNACHATRRSTKEHVWMVSDINAYIEAKEGDLGLNLLPNGRLVSNTEQLNHDPDKIHQNVDICSSYMADFEPNVIIKSEDGSLGVDLVPDDIGRFICVPKKYSS